MSHQLLYLNFFLFEIVLLCEPKITLILDECIVLLLSHPTYISIVFLFTSSLLAVVVYDFDTICGYNVGDLILYSLWESFYILLQYILSCLWFDVSILDVGGHNFREVCLNNFVISLQVDGLTDRYLSSFMVLIYILFIGSD